MGRKNRRRKIEYRRRLGFNPAKYVTPVASISTSVRRSANTDYGGQPDYRDRHPDYGGRPPKRGDIWFADLGYRPGTSVQGGCRPVLIVSNDIGNYYGQTMNVLPITRHMKKPDLPCHTELDPAVLSDRHQTMDTSMILAEQITTISKLQLRSYVGRIEDADLLNRINTSIRGQLALDTAASAQEHGKQQHNNKF